MAKRGDTWGMQETNLVLDLWAEENIQRQLNDCPKRNIKIFEQIASAANASSPNITRTAEEVRSRLKRLKSKYFQLKQKSQKKRRVVDKLAILAET